MDPWHAPDLELELDLAYGHVPEPRPAHQPCAPAPGCAGKVRYTDKRAAHSQVNRVQRAGRGELRAYWCSQCRGWHLTKKPEWVR